MLFFWWSNKLQNLWCHQLLLNKSYTFFCFFGILCSIKIWDLTSVPVMPKFPNSFLVLLQRLETSSRIFYDINKMAVKCNFLIFIGWLLLFLVVSEHIFKIVKSHNLIIMEFWLILNWRAKEGLGSEPSAQKRPKTSKILHNNISKLAKFHDHMIYNSRHIHKMYSILYIMC